MLTPLGQELENLALHGARLEFPRLRQASLFDLHEVSAFSFATGFGVVMLVALLRGKPLLAVTAAAILGFSVVVAGVAKDILVRPGLVDAPPVWLNNSFPSGHVAVAVAIGIGAVLVVPYRLRPIAAVLGAAYAIGIGQAVATAGWHRLSGVVGATFLVLAVASVGIYFLARNRSVQRISARHLAGALVASGILGAVVVLIGGVGLVLGLGRLLPVPEQPTRDAMFAAFSTTLLISTGVVAFAFLAFLWLIRPFTIDELAADVGVQADGAE